MSGSNFIGGARSAAGNVRLQSFDARTGEALPVVFTQATPDEVDAAAHAAEQAFAEYNGLAPERRAQFLDAIAGQLDALGEAFIDTVCRETALPAARIQGRTQPHQQPAAPVRPGAAPWRLPGCPHRPRPAPAPAAAAP